jgi:hypothetical protein
MIHSKGKDIGIGKYNLSITQEKIYQVSKNEKTAHSWNAIDNIAITDQNLLIITQDSRAYIVPKRAFANDAAFTEFAETAKKYHQAALASAKTV